MTCVVINFYDNLDVLQACFTTLMPVTDHTETGRNEKEKGHKNYDDDWGTRMGKREGEKGPP